MIILRRWWARISSRIVPAFGRLRLTLAVFVIILVVGIVLGSLGSDEWSVFVQRYAWDLTSLQQGHVWSAWLGLFFSVDADDYYGMLVLVLLTVGVLEYRRGTRLAAFGFLLVGPVASIITLLVLWPLSNAGVEYVRGALFIPDSGASTACFVCLGIFLWLEKGLWRNILMLVMLAVLGALFYRNAVYNIDHLDGFLIGIGTGTILGWQNNHKARKSPPDVRIK